MVSQVTEQTEQMRGMLANLEADEANLQQKIDKRKQELDRHQKRLASLQTVRPAFMDEYERLEGELSVQYSMYVQAWRNLSYLESELDAIHALEVSLVNCLGWPRMASDCLGFPLTERLWPLSRRSASPRTIGRCTRCSAGYERRSFGSCVGRPR
jgi:hypothetical protein